MTKPPIVSEETRRCHLGFNHFQKIGPLKLRTLEKYFLDLRRAWSAGRSELERAGLKPELAKEFTEWRSSFQMTVALSELEKENIDYVTWHETAYPRILKEISVPPPLLYYRGRLDGIEHKRLSVVGARQHSAYAEKVITEILPPAIGAGIEIVSGLALGVDTLAHRVAIGASGRTIAILGSGLKADLIYPSANRHLAAEIITTGGALISEFPPQTPPYRQNFPQRNRIIAGLSQATLVIEAQQKSGSLITAAYALEQNREVLAVPGNIFSKFSDGPNRLIGAGAKIILSAEDILDIFGIPANAPIPAGHIKDSAQSAPYRPTNKAEAIIYGLLQAATARAEKITADQIIKTSQLDTALVNSTLSILEIAGIAKNTESGYDLN
ncbi:MAG: DNA-processing protein DprA [Patescibacteria group bacterium]